MLAFTADEAASNIKFDLNGTSVASIDVPPNDFGVPVPRFFPSEAIGIELFNKPRTTSVQSGSRTGSDHGSPSRLTWHQMPSPQTVFPRLTAETEMPA